MDIDIHINRQNDLKKINIWFILLTAGMFWNIKDKNQLQKGFRNLDYLINYYLTKYGIWYARRSFVRLLSSWIINILKFKYLVGWLSLY